MAPTIVVVSDIPGEGSMACMLRNYARQMMIVMAVYAFPVGLMAGVLLAHATVFSDEPRVDELTVLGIVGLGTPVLFMVGMLVSLVWISRTDSRLKRELTGRSAALSTAGTLRPVPARVLRTRPAAKYPGFVVGQAGPASPTSTIVMLTALADDGPRLAAALVPPQVGAQMRRGGHVGGVVDPDGSTMVLDPRLPGRPDDPRWAGKLPDPGHRSALLGCAIGVAVGLLVGVTLLGVLVVL